MPERKMDLIQLRLKQAREAIADVDFLIQNDRMILAINRIYYGMFYSLLALAIQYDFKTSKHAQLIGWFNKEFVKNKKIEPRFSKMVQSAFNARSDGDYGVFSEFSKEEVLIRFEEMKEFIVEIENYISK
ncbi:MAG TPA: HEPN domain-containing protein [Prolixibacteraceae bacterium]|nr:HEPN domain-containing protein [Prolixibacteraceae bacterium]